MKQLFELRELSQHFYEDFPRGRYPEVEAKPSRPCAVLLIRISGILFGIPLRTNIRHRYCYRFRTSDRKTDSSTGLDFTKAVVLLEQRYLGQETTINKKEFIELQDKAYFIVKQFKKYVDDYIEYKKNDGNDYVSRRYRYSTLHYFDDVLLSKKD